MVTIYFILKLLPGILESVILWRLLTSLMLPKYTKTVMILPAAGMVLLDGVKLWILAMPGMERYHIYGMMLVMLYILGTFCFLTRNTIAEKLAWWGIYLFILIIMEMSAVLLLSSVFKSPLELYASNDMVNIGIVIIIKVLTLLIFEVIIRKRKGQLAIGVSFFKELIIVIFSNMLLIIVVAFTFTNRHTIVNKIDNIILLLFGVVLFITIYTVMLIFRIEKKSNDELETQLKLQQIGLELKQNHDMLEMTERQKRLRTDMTKHIHALKDLVYKEEYEGLKIYIDQLCEEAETVNELMVSENRILSVMLNARKALAKEKKIQFASNIAVEDVAIDNRDFSLLFGNLLDNAIDAAAQATNQRKYVEFSIQKQNNSYIIHCENSYQNKPVMKKEAWFLHNSNHLLCGSRTDNIKGIVAKYNGEISFEYDDTVFCVHIVIPAQPDSE